jgi:hypothetical protein
MDERPKNNKSAIQLNGIPTFVFSYYIFKLNKIVFWAHVGKGMGQIDVLSPLLYMGLGIGMRLHAFLSLVLEEHVFPGCPYLLYRRCLRTEGSLWQEIGWNQQPTWSREKNLHSWERRSIATLLPSSQPNRSIDMLIEILVSLFISD